MPAVGHSLEQLAGLADDAAWPTPPAPPVPGSSVVQPRSATSAPAAGVTIEQLQAELERVRQERDEALLAAKAWEAEANAAEERTRRVQEEAEAEVAAVKAR